MLSKSKQQAKATPPSCAGEEGAAGRIPSWPQPCHLYFRPLLLLWLDHMMALLALPGPWFRPWKEQEGWYLQ